MSGGFRRWTQAVGEGLAEYYRAPFRQTLAREARARDDLFMLLVFSDSLGIPNPAAPYTLELMPLMWDDFHDWHLRMGMPHSPLDHVKCC